VLYTEACTSLTKVVNIAMYLMRERDGKYGAKPNITSPKLRFNLNLRDSPNLISIVSHPIVLCPSFAITVCSTILIAAVQIRLTPRCWRRQSKYGCFARDDFILPTRIDGGLVAQGEQHSMSETAEPHRSCAVDDR
jgi:hypothetical protein